MKIVNVTGPNIGELVYDSNGVDPHELRVTGDVVVIDGGQTIRVDYKTFMKLGVFWGIFLSAHVLDILEEPASGVRCTVVE